MSVGERREGLKIAVWGVLWIVGAVAFWLYAAGNPINDLRLALSASVAAGQVTDSWEDAEDTDSGGLSWSHGVAYTFFLPDGFEVKSGEVGSGRLRSEFVDLKRPVPVEIEYLAGSPAVNRLKGNGSQSLGEWLLRKVGVGGLLLVVFLLPGVQLFRSGVAELRSAQKLSSR